MAAVFVPTEAKAKAQAQGGSDETAVGLIVFRQDGRKGKPADAEWRLHGESLLGMVRAAVCRPI